MRTRLALTLIAITVVGTAAITLFASNSAHETIFVTDFGPTDSLFVSTAHAGDALNEMDVAKTMRVRIAESGTDVELVFGSFSRIGFISVANEFLLESLPSEDKKPFYRFVR